MTRFPSRNEEANKSRTNLAAYKCQRGGLASSRISWVSCTPTLSLSLCFAMSALQHGTTSIFMSCANKTSIGLVPINDSLDGCGTNRLPQLRRFQDESHSLPPLIKLSTARRTRREIEAESINSIDYGMIFSQP